ncbi:MAG: hypothetical protein BWY17_02464 [Deltaproteobacteria bacterium ADurb.Bin207]|jgi:hypothetical protein|nr:MAG: hypothetical protein BWY17_02464 [Deltaproteobacteria bacterium ADurb.Bin207]
MPQHATKHGRPRERGHDESHALNLHRMDALGDWLDHLPNKLLVAQGSGVAHCGQRR